MNFTPNLPTQPGFYAWKREESPERNVYIIKIFKNSTGLFIEQNSSMELKDIGGLWCRLVPAEETVRIKTRCPACGNTTLIIDEAGYLICTLVSCTDSTLITRLAQVLD